jgi:hypothetical protein
MIVNTLSPIREMKTRGTPLSVQQELVLHLVEEEKLIYAQVCARLGISMSDLRTLYWTAKMLRANYARHGVDSPWLLPTRARWGLENVGLTTRAKVKKAIAAGVLGWDNNQRKVIYKGARVRNLGRKSWCILQEWVADDWVPEVLKETEE